MWLICVACHHHAELKAKIGAKLICSQCGSRASRRTRVLKMSMLNGGRTPAEDARISTFAGLLSIANHRGYKRGWAAVKWRIIYGKWPDGLDPSPDNPSPELAWWIGKQNAAYAKTKRESEVMINAGSAKAEPDNVRPQSYEAGAVIPGTLMTQADLEVDL